MYAMMARNLPQTPIPGYHESNRSEKRLSGTAAGTTSTTPSTTTPSSLATPTAGRGGLRSGLSGLGSLLLHTKLFYGLTDTRNLVA